MSFTVFDVNDTDTFTEGIKVLNQMIDEYSTTPIVYDADKIKKDHYKIWLEIDNYQKNQNHLGSFFGTWANRNGNTFCENAYIFAFVLGNDEFIRKYKCVYGDDSGLSRARGGETVNWYQILKHITGLDPCPDFELTNDKDTCKMCQDYYKEIHPKHPNGYKPHPKNPNGYKPKRKLGEEYGNPSDPGSPKKHHLIIVCIATLLFMIVSDLSITYKGAEKLAPLFNSIIFFVLFLILVKLFKL